MLLSGRHAVVTGGGRGIGRAVAARLRREGARVSIIGR
ncbi:MAG: 3-hydroxyacyl-CoA dehydrogenase, partial [Methylobacterium sp.]|nr:3-hydroxyacyl-CoA dehydrogenase [Methylobacterium sp.]